MQSPQSTYSYNTDITTDAPCFCEGTRILTDRGESAVETLTVGDVVVTRQDGAETLSPVRWIGRRRVIVARHHEAEHVDPIRIVRDAIAPGLPARDLFVSPDHALYLDGMLIQARQLVNHMTITRDSGRTVVTYYHVELDSHAILLADGMPCESYLDTGNRGQFDAAGSVVPLHGEATDRMQRACAPFVTSASLVQPVWQRLADRALRHGHVAPARDLESDLSLWFETADGLRLMPDGNRHRVALPLGCRRVRLRSCSDFATTLSPWSDDRRRLGVAISASPPSRRPPSRLGACRPRCRLVAARDRGEPGLALDRRRRLDRSAGTGQRDRDHAARHHASARRQAGAGACRSPPGADRLTESRHDLQGKPLVGGACCEFQ